MDPDKSEADNAAVQAGFLRLRANFVAGLPKRLAAIEGAGSFALREIELHKLSGAAGSYGYAALSVAARRAEALCAGDKLREVLPDGGWEAALAEVRQALEQASVTVP